MLKLFLLKVTWPISEWMGVIFLGMQEEKIEKCCICKVPHVWDTLAERYCYDTLPPICGISMPVFLELDPA